MEDSNLESFEHEGVLYEIGDFVGYEKIAWSSDWNGYEVGYSDIPVVGLYSFAGTEVYMYINSEDGSILEMWSSDDE